MRRTNFIGMVCVLLALQGCTSMRDPGYAGYAHGYDNDPYAGTYSRGGAYPGAGRYSAGAYDDVRVQRGVIAGVREQMDRPSGGGAAVGALLGGILGHQVGKGSGRDLATIGGALAGGLIGNEMERQQAHPQVVLQVRADDGRWLELQADAGRGYRVGDVVQWSWREGRAFLLP